MIVPPKRYLEEVLRAAIEAVEPGRLVRRALARNAGGISVSSGAVPFFAGWDSIRNVFLVGGGKAGRAMGEAAAEILGKKAASGIIAVPRGEEGNAGTVRFVGAGHPDPDAGSREAAKEMLRLLDAAGEKDLVLALLSGGGSAMISLPVEGVRPSDKGKTSRLLMDAGANIEELNTVRKHLSRVKGGRMAVAAHPARVFALLLSDVPGDDPSLIASGPFNPDPTRFEDAMKILARRKIDDRLPDSVRAYLDAGLKGTAPETPKQGDLAFDRVAFTVIGSNEDALKAASRAAERPGIECLRTFPGFLREESRESARAFVAELKNASGLLSPGKQAVLIAGGETTVTVRGTGKGGRCQELALAMAIAMDGEKELAVLCAGTDGIDGPTDAAGAYADGSTCARAAVLGLSPEAALKNNDAYTFFKALSDLTMTGPTGTNVADLVIGLAGPPP